MLRILVTLFVISTVFAFSAKAENTDSSMQTYWTEFHQAVNNNDYTTLSNLSRFPLAIHGELDFIPVRNIEKKNFKKVFKKVLDQEQIDFVDGKESIKTLRDVVIETRELKKTHILGKGEYFRVGDLVFSFKDERWALIKSYLSEE